MPLFSILRFIFALISLVILGAGLYLLWSWYDGHHLRDIDGNLVIIRDDWRLWTGV